MPYIHSPKVSPKGEKTESYYAREWGAGVFNCLQGICLLEKMPKPGKDSIWLSLFVGIPLSLISYHWYLQPGNNIQKITSKTQRSLHELCRTPSQTPNREFYKPNQIIRYTTPPASGNGRKNKQKNPTN